MARQDGVVDRRWQNSGICPEFLNESYRIKKGSRRPIYSNWVGSRYNAGAHGTSLLRDIFGETRFPFPKSLYTTEDF